VLANSNCEFCKQLTVGVLFEGILQFSLLLSGLDSEAEIESNKGDQKMSPTVGCIIRDHAQHHLVAVIET